LLGGHLTHGSDLIGIIRLRAAGLAARLIILGQCHAREQHHQAGKDAQEENPAQRITHDRLRFLAVTRSASLVEHADSGPQSAGPRDERQYPE